MSGETRTGTVVAWTSDLKVSPETRAKLHEQSLAALARARADRDEEAERLACLKSPPRAPNEAAHVVRTEFKPNVELARKVMASVKETIRQAELKPVLDAVGPRGVELRTLCKEAAEQGASEYSDIRPGDHILGSHPAALPEWAHHLRLTRTSVIEAVLDALGVP